MLSLLRSDVPIYWRRSEHIEGVTLSRYEDGKQGVVFVCLTKNPKDRRDIEKEAFSGKLLGIVATNALELGINIGSLDAVIMLGFPFSVASLVRHGKGQQTTYPDFCSL